MRKAVTVLMAGLLVGLAGCSYQDFARPPVRNYLGDIFYKPKRPPELGKVEVQRLDELAEAMARWRETIGLTREEYTLGPRDALKVSILVPTQLDASVTAEFEVNRDGTAACPLLGDVQVAGLTTRQVEKKLAKLYGERYYRNPAISVVISEYRSKPIFMTGAVANPGVVYLSANRITLLEALLLAGGLGENPGDTAQVTRAVEAAGGSGKSELKAQTIRADIARLIKGSDMVQNIWIYPGDVIHIAPAEAKYFYVLGYVRAPGVYPFPEGGSFRVMDAIAYARGLDGGAHPEKVYLHRRTTEGSENIYRVDLTRIAAAKEPDVIMEPGDRIIVGTGWGRRFIEGLLHSLGLRQLAPVPLP